MKNHILACLMIAVVICCSAAKPRAADSNFTYRDYYDRAYAETQKGMREEALKDLKKSMAMMLNFSPSYSLRGYIYLLVQDNDKAIADCTKAIAIDPRDENPYLYRAQAYGKQQKYDLALSDYNKAIEINPRSADAYFRRGLLYALDRNEEAQMKDYVKSFELDPANPAVCGALVGVLMVKRDYANALLVVNRAIEAAPKEFLNYVLRAQISLMTKDYDQAWNDVHKVESLRGFIDPGFLKKLKSESGRDG